MSDKSHIKAFTRNIDGFLNDRDGSFLHDLAEKVTGEGVIVEIGSWKGKSTIWLGKGTEKGNRVIVYAVDHHKGSPEHQKESSELWTFDEFKQNMRMVGLNDQVIPIVKTSSEASREFEKGIELLFIDGAHDYDSVKSDYDSWFPKVINGGLIAFHDSEFYGVSEFLEELVKTGKDVKLVSCGGSIVCAQKVDRVRWLDALINRQVVKAIKFRRSIGLARKTAPSLLKPIYNLVRNFAKVYRFILLRVVP